MSSKLIQYDLFEPPVSEVEDLKRYVDELKTSQDKVRRAMFAKHGELSKLYLDLHERFYVIERNLCKK